MGPFKHTLDDGLDIRKVGCVSSMFKWNCAQMYSSERENLTGVHLKWLQYLIQSSYLAKYSSWRHNLIIARVCCDFNDAIVQNQQ